MTRPNPVSTKTITLIIGIIVAIFLFLSATYFQMNKEESTETTNDANPGTSQVLNVVSQRVASLYSILQEL